MSDMDEREMDMERQLSVYTHAGTPIPRTVCIYGSRDKVDTYAYQCISYMVLVRRQAYIYSYTPYMYS